MVFFSIPFAYYLIKMELNTKIITLVLLILGIASVHLLVEVHGRYHYPVISIFALLAGFGFSKIIELYNNIKQRMFNSP